MSDATLQNTYEVVFHQVDAGMVSTETALRLTLDFNLCTQSSTKIEKHQARTFLVCIRGICRTEDAT